MTCEEAVKKLYEYIDRELDHTSVRQLDKHLELCKLCCGHFEFERRMKLLVQESCFQSKAPQCLKNKILDDLRALE